MVVSHPPRKTRGRKTINGPIAQLGERCVRNAEVMGSNPTRSTTKKDSFEGSFFVVIQSVGFEPERVEA